jgi:hypothetical protein
LAGIAQPRNGDLSCLKPAPWQVGHGGLGGAGFQVTGSKAESVGGVQAVIQEASAVAAAAGHWQQHKPSQFGDVVEIAG